MHYLVLFSLIKNAQYTLDIKLLVRTDKKRCSNFKVIIRIQESIVKNGSNISTKFC